MQDNLKLYESSFENAGIGIALVSLEGKFLKVNDKFCEITMFSSKELLNKTFKDITYPEDIGPNLQKDEELIIKKIPNYSMEKRYVRKDKKIIWVNLSVSLLFDDQDKPEYYISQVVDITKQKHSELQLKQKNEDLKGFAKNVAHDLKSPIGSIVSFCKLLEVGEEIDPDLVNDISKLGGSLNTLINELLDYSTIEDRSFENESIDLNSVLNQILELNKLRIDEINAKFVSEKLPRIDSNLNTIKQVFRNIIDNAIKYRNPDQTLHMDIKISELNDTNLIIEFTDNGLGFSRKESHNIFIPLTRLKETKSVEGHGIGLASCKKALEKLGGQIWAESPNETGASFFVLIPRNQEK